MVIKFCNLNFKGLKRNVLFQDDKKLKVIIPTNAELIVKAQNNEKFKNIISYNHATFDGQVPYYFAKKQNKNIDIEKISGSDLIYNFCQMAKEKNKKIFLLGGYEDSNKESIMKLRDKYDVDIDGFSPPYKPYPFEKEHNDLIILKLQNYKPDILFVGFGAMKQEFWIEENKKVLKQLGIKWIIGSGGTFEFVAGKIKRSPKIIQQIGLEGVWRLFSEPKWFRVKRLLVSLLIFKYIWRSNDSTK